MKSTPPKQPPPSATRRKASESKSPKVGDLLGGKYTLRRKLGEGGMGSVFAAHQRDFDREVAIKVLLPRGMSAERLLKQLKREAKTLAAVDHPNVVNVFDAGVTEEGLPFLVMEFVEGKTLRTLCEREGLLDPLVSITLARQMADALAAAHAKKIVHCDLKPDNVLLKSDGRVKVGDFGLARSLEQTSQHTTNQRFDGCGTPFYMAPELWRDEEPSPASDVYALGATLTEMLTGRPLFHQDSVELLSRAEVRRKHLQERPESLEKTFAPLLAPLGRLVDSMVAKAPRKRPTAVKVAEELRREYERLEPHFYELTRPAEISEDGEDDFENEEDFEREDGSKSQHRRKSADAFQSEDGSKSKDAFEDEEDFESEPADRSSATWPDAEPETPWKPRQLSAPMRAFLAGETGEKLETFLSFSGLPFGMRVQNTVEPMANAPEDGRFGAFGTERMTPPPSKAPGVGAFGTERMTPPPRPKVGDLGRYGTERMTPPPSKAPGVGAFGTERTPPPPTSKASGVAAFGTERMPPPPTSKARDVAASAMPPPTSRSRDVAVGTERKLRRRERAVPSDEAITRPQTARPSLPNARPPLPWKHRPSPAHTQRRRWAAVARHPLAIGLALVFALLLGVIGRDFLQSLRASKAPEAATTAATATTNAVVPSAPANPGAPSVGPSMAVSALVPEAPLTVPQSEAPTAASTAANAPSSAGPSAPKPKGVATSKTTTANPSVVDPWPRPPAQKHPPIKPSTQTPPPSAIPAPTGVLPFGKEEP